jgi:uncharacterized protein
MLLRLLILLGVALLVWSKLRWPSVKAAARAKPDAARRALPPAEAMVDCAHCGLHLPASEAVRDAGSRPYCGAAHRLAGPRGGR